MTFFLIPSPGTYVHLSKLASAGFPGHSGIPPASKTGPKDLKSDQRALVENMAYLLIYLEV